MDLDELEQEKHSDSEQEKHSESTEAREDMKRQFRVDSQVKVSAKLIAYLREMVNNPAFSDVVFVCDDEERVHASRSLLAGRSEILKGMLFSDMAESSLAQIMLPQISSTVLLCVLEFLYTGTLSKLKSKYYPRSWRVACEVISASQFFILPDLDVKVRKFMLDQISSVKDDLRAVASLLTEAMEWKVLCGERDVSLREIVTILNSKWSEPRFVQSLSEDAFHFLLASSKGNCDQLSFEEYLRFRQVIRWWIYQLSWRGLSGEVEEHLNCIIPDEQRAASMITTYLKPSKSVESLAKNFVPQLSVLENFWAESRNSVDRLLSNIDFRRMHPLLLATVKQLKLVSSTEIESAFEHQALRSHRILQRESCEWNCGSPYLTCDRGYLIYRDHWPIGVAVMMAPMSRLSPVYKWSFYVEEMPYPFFELGFTCQKFHSEERLSKRDSARVLESSHIEETRITSGSSSQWKKLRRSLMDGSKVTFSFNPYNGFCSLIIDRKDYGIVWEKIPAGTYYPAVCLGESDRGRIRIELLSGFDG